MNLQFRIRNKIIRRKKSSSQDDSTDYLFCSFIFETKEWKHIDKYAIFWNKKGKNVIQYITDKKQGQCPIPKMCLDDLYFYVQVYANDNICTQKLKVFTQNICSCKKKLPNHKCKEDIDEVLSSDPIDKIVYDDNRLLIYSDNRLVNTIELVDEALIQKVITGQAPEYIVDTVLSKDSENPLANKTLYNLLSQKVERDQLSRVAFTGKYSDLKDIPVEFPPSSHTHNTLEIIDLEEDMDEVLNYLTNEFKKGD